VISLPESVEISLPPRSWTLIVYEIQVVVTIAQCGGWLTQTNLYCRAKRHRFRAAGAALAIAVRGRKGNGLPDQAAGM